jgi:polyisoprenoid-binding protein YceI
VACAAALVLAAVGARAQPEVFAVDPAKSRLRIELGRAGLLKMFGHDHEIEAPISEGSIEAEPEDPRRSRVTLRFEAARLAVVPGTEPAKDIPDVEARMRGPEVLDVEHHPQIAFESSRVDGEAAAGGIHRLRVRGWLELKGRRTEVEVPLEVRREAEGLLATGHLELKLRDLGIDPPSVAGVVKVANRFRIVFDIRARRRSPDLSSAPERGVGVTCRSRGIHCGGQPVEDSYRLNRGPVSTPPSRQRTAC